MSPAMLPAVLPPGVADPTIPSNSSVHNGVIVETRPSTSFDLREKLRTKKAPFFAPATVGTILAASAIVLLLLRCSFHLSRVAKKSDTTRVLSVSDEYSSCEEVYSNLMTSSSTTGTKNRDSFLSSVLKTIPEDVSSNSSGAYNTSSSTLLFPHTHSSSSWGASPARTPQVDFPYLLLWESVSPEVQTLRYPVIASHHGNTPERQTPLVGSIRPRWSGTQGTKTRKASRIPVPVFTREHSVDEGRATKIDRNQPFLPITLGSRGYSSPDLRQRIENKVRAPPAPRRVGDREYTAAELRKLIAGKGLPPPPPLPAKMQVPSRQTSTPAKTLEPQRRLLHYAVHLDRPKRDAQVQANMDSVTMDSPNSPYTSFSRRLVIRPSPEGAHGSNGKDWASDISTPEKASLEQKSVKGRNKVKASIQIGVDAVPLRPCEPPKIYWPPSPPMAWLLNYQPGTEHAFDDDLTVFDDTVLSRPPAFRDGSGGSAVLDRFESHDLYGHAEKSDAFPSTFDTSSTSNKQVDKLSGRDESKGSSPEYDNVWESLSDLRITPSPGMVYNGPPKLSKSTIRGAEAGGFFRAVSVGGDARRKSLDYSEPWEAHNVPGASSFDEQKEESPGRPRHIGSRKQRARRRPWSADYIEPWVQLNQASRRAAEKKKGEHSAWFEHTNRGAKINRETRTSSVEYLEPWDSLNVLSSDMQKNEQSVVFRPKSYGQLWDGIANTYGSADTQIIGAAGSTWDETERKGRSSHGRPANQRLPTEWRHGMHVPGGTRWGTIFSKRLNRDISHRHSHNFDEAYKKDDTMKKPTLQRSQQAFLDERLSYKGSVFESPEREIRSAGLEEWSPRFQPFPGQVFEVAEPPLGTKEAPKVQGPGRTPRNQLMSRSGPAQPASRSQEGRSTLKEGLERLVAESYVKPKDRKNTKGPWSTTLASFKNFRRRLSRRL